MGEAALAAVPEISEISMACPNMHFILMNLSAFGLDNNNDVFLPTDEPHGQIECTVGQGCIVTRKVLCGGNRAIGMSGRREGGGPSFSCNSGHSRSGLNGTAVKRMPVASARALPSAAATGL